jgi:hypothetical protein
MKSAVRIALTLVFCLISATLVFPQEKPGKKDKNTAPVQRAAPVSPAPTRPPLEFGLSEDTPVKIKLTRTMSSKDAKVDEKVDFEVLEDIKVRDVVVVQHGAMAIGTVTEAQPKRRMGRAGKLNINIDYVQLVDGEKVPLRAVKGGSGGNHTGAMTGAIVASSLLFFPAAPFFLFMHGKDITIPKGTEVSAYVSADTALDPAKFNKQSAAVESGTAKPEASATTMSPVAIKSTPDGAEITIDGKLVGTTPSTVQLTPGEHIISINKSGFKQWQRTITVTAGGAINLEATLDKLP